MVIENFKVGGLARFGLDYPTLAAGNPGLLRPSRRNPAPPAAPCLRCRLHRTEPGPGGTTRRRRDELNQPDEVLCWISASPTTAFPSRSS
ncbi:hypothetical protein [Paracoccus mutanolyticus]|uniref:hypothetical protein n=1 Tax=Paracoccus mutanolyticus TaxID=1499308 RepID=UPI0037C936A3